MCNSRWSHKATEFLLGVTAVAVLSAGVLIAQGPPPAGQRGSGPPRQQPKPDRKQVLVWCDTTGGGAYHDSVSHAMAVIEKMGRDTKLFDAYLRTDSQLITKQKISVRANGRDWANNKNLDYFDAIFFYGLREIPLTEQQKADLIAFVKEDGKGFVSAHTAVNAFQEYPAFAEMMGAGFDNHPWNMAEAKVIVEDPAFPGMEGFAPAATMREEWYQVKDFSREKARVLMRLDTSTVDLKNPNVHRTDDDFPQAWIKMAGKGRVYFNAMGHAPETWDRPEVQKMWLEAIKWALGMTNPDMTPRPMPAK
jgi:type 1 glutamine amidotransferase